MSTPQPPLDKRKTDGLVEKIMQRFKRGPQMAEFVEDIIQQVKHKRLKGNQEVKFTTHLTQLSLTSRVRYQSLIEEARICINENNFDELRKNLLPKLRQICIHYKLIMHGDKEDSTKFEHQDVSTNLNLQSILTRRVLQEKDQCSICLSTPFHALITKCTHIFCWNCIRKWFERPNKPVKCPCCRGLLTIDDMFSETKPDTKLEILMKLLKEDSSTNSKSVVVSRYANALCYFNKHLQNAGFNTLISTTVTMKCAENVIKKFKNIDGPIVLLIDFGTTRKKQILINVPCRVFILDACRKSVEEELVARVTKPVSVSRLISENTIEDKIISLNLNEKFAEGPSFDFNDKLILRYLLKEDSDSKRHSKRVIRKPTHLDDYVLKSEELDREVSKIRPKTILDYQSSPFLGMRFLI